MTPKLSVLSAIPEPGFGVYVHWPFCASKCPYCDFNSHVRHEPPDQSRFVSAFRRELEHAAEKTPGRVVSSIFFGGGTPSLMAPDTVGAILEAIGDRWTVPDGVEITLEANPSSVEAERFRGYRAVGVNRVSLGVQALNDTDLRFLGRLHTVAEAMRAVEIARTTFPRISFDLIYARPGQTPGRVGARTHAGACARRRSSLCLSIDDRSRNALRGSLESRQADCARRGYSGGIV